MKLKCFFLLTFFGSAVFANSKVPMVINTWAFTEATEAAWDLLRKSVNGVDAVEAGCSVCERLQCEGTVGYGGSPDENGETTLDALIFDGTAMDMGAVGALREVKDAISVARHVLEHTSHSLLVGDQATNFAKEMGFQIQSLTTDRSRKIWRNWWSNQCQPNSWKNVEPDSKEKCGPYKPLSGNSIRYKRSFSQTNMASEKNHDTIGMVVIDSRRNIVAGTSTNGMTHKIPGRVGDSPIPGAGAYADSDVGGAAATGDGDVMMRFLPSFLAVEEMRRGKDPTEAASVAINRIVKKYPDFFGGVVAVDKKGNFGAACNGMEEFKFSVANSELKGVKLLSVVCKNRNNIL